MSRRRQGTATDEVPDQVDQRCDGRGGIKERQQAGFERPGARPHVSQPHGAAPTVATPLRRRCGRHFYGASEGDPSVGRQEDVVGADIVVQQRLTFDDRCEVNLIFAQPVQHPSNGGV